CRVVAKVVQQVEQGVLGGVFVLSALGELGAAAADVAAPPATVKKGLRTARHGRFLQEENLRRKREQRGRLCSDWTRTSRPPRHLYDAHFTRSGPVKSGRKSGKGRNPGVREKARLTTALCCGEPCERRGDWIRTSDLLNPIHKLTLPP